MSSNPPFTRRKDFWGCRRPSGLTLVGTIVCVLAAGPSHAAESSLDGMERARDVPAMAGHDAEAKARDPADESRRERLFFAPAAIEIGEAGVDCGHRRVRRPDSIAGTGAVVVAVDSVTGRVLLRLWAAPETTRPNAPVDLAALERQARDRLGEGGTNRAITIEATGFAWCR